MRIPIKGLWEYLKWIVMPVYIISWGIYLIFELTWAQFNGCVTLLWGILLLLSGIYRTTND